MKKNNTRFIILCFAALLLFTIPINALTRSSDYIHDYTIGVYVSDQKIYTEFSIDATKKMTKLGASAIKIYEYPYSSQDLVNTKTEYSAGMTAKNCSSYSNSIAYTGKSNKKYRHQWI